MTKGPRRIVLDQYLDSASEGVVKGAGRDWKRKADDLQELADALKQAARQAELRIGEQTLTGPAIRASMEESSTSMTTKADQLRAAGEALRVVGVQIADTRDARDSMKDLGEKPAPYQAPAGTPGVETTKEDLQAQADASAARQAERSSWQTAYEKQEARSLALTKEMDAAFLAAIPPMQEIHGQQDPTEPPPDVPSGPDGPYLPGTQAPPVTGGGAGGGDNGGQAVAVHYGGRQSWLEQVSEPTNNTNNEQNPPKPPHVIECHLTPVTEPPTHVHHTETPTPTTTVSGASQSGVTYQGPGGGTTTPAASAASVAPSGSTGVSAGALGAAGAAGGASGMAGSIRAGSAPMRGAGSVRAIGSTARAGAPGSLSRPAGPTSSSTSSARTAGSPASRAGSPAGRGAAGARGSATGSGAGSRSGARGAGGAGGRGGRKGERDQATDRDRLVYDQDWLGDDDVAPGVLD